MDGGMREYEDRQTSERMHGLGRRKGLAFWYSSRVALRCVAMRNRVRKNRVYESTTFVRAEAALPHVNVC